MKATKKHVVVLDYGFGNVRSAVRALEKVGADVELTADRQRALKCDGLLVPGVGALAACMNGIRSVGGDEIILERAKVGAPLMGICVGMQVLFTNGTEGEGADCLDIFNGTVTKLNAPVIPHIGWNTVRTSSHSKFFHNIPDERFYFVHSYGVEVDAHSLSFCAKSQNPASSASLHALALDSYGQTTALRSVHYPLNDTEVDMSIRGGGRGKILGNRKFEAERKTPLGLEGSILAPTPTPNAASVSTSALTATTRYGKGEFLAAIETDAILATQFHPEKSAEAGLQLIENWVSSL